MQAFIISRLLRSSHNHSMGPCDRQGSNSGNTGLKNDRSANLKSSKLSQWPNWPLSSVLHPSPGTQGIFLTPAFRYFKAGHMPTQAQLLSTAPTCQHLLTFIPRSSPESPNPQAPELSAYSNIFPAASAPTSPLLRLE